MDMDGTWMAVDEADGCGWTWMAVDEADGCGWTWMDADGGAGDYQVECKEKKILT